MKWSDFGVENNRHSGSFALFELHIESAEQSEATKEIFGGHVMRESTFNCFGVILVVK